MVVFPNDFYSCFSQRQTWKNRTKCSCLFLEQRSGRGKSLIEELHGFSHINHWKIHISVPLEAEIRKMALEVMLMAQSALN